MDAPIFVVGSGRSGTTVLERSLGQHEKLVSFPFEPQVISRSDLSMGLFQLFNEHPSIDKLKSYLYKRYSFKPTRQEKKLGFCQWCSKSEYERLVEKLLINFHTDAENISNHIRNFLNELYSPYVSSNNAVNWIDGSPVNGRLIPQILKIFPGSYFVHVIRDGRDVSNSFLRLGWGQGSFEIAAQFWACQVRTIRQLGHRYGQGKYIEVLFEDLIESPEVVMRRILDFLHLDYESNVSKLINQKRANKYIVEHTSYQNEYIRCIAPDLIEEFNWKI